MILVVPNVILSLLREMLHRNKIELEENLTRKKYTVLKGHE